jgi:hypothetical protein
MEMKLWRRKKEEELVLLESNKIPLIQIYKIEKPELDESDEILYGFELFDKEMDISDISHALTHLKLAEILLLELYESM